MGPSPERLEEMQAEMRASSDVLQGGEEEEVIEHIEGRLGVASPAMVAPFVRELYAIHWDGWKWALDQAQLVVANDRQWEIMRAQMLRMAEARWRMLRSRVSQYLAEVEQDKKEKSHEQVANVG